MNETVHPTTRVEETRVAHVSTYHWPSIVAGAFVTLALMVVSVILAQACDVDVTFRNATSTAGQTGAIIWGGIAALVAFGIGGMIAGRGAVSTVRRSGSLHGLIVWAVAVPLLVALFNTGMGPRLGPNQELAGVSPAIVASSAQVASDRVTEEPAQPLTNGSPNSISQPQAAAWWMLASLGLGLVGAAAMGAFASQKS